MGDVIAFEEIVRMRRQRVAHALHARCRTILAAAVAEARAALVEARSLNLRPYRPNPTPIGGGLIDVSSWHDQVSEGGQ